MDKSDNTNLSKGAEIIQLIKTEVLEGYGTPESIMRIVEYYYDLEGNLIFRKDTLNKEINQNDI